VLSQLFPALSCVAKLTVMFQVKAPLFGYLLTLRHARHFRCGYCSPIPRPCFCSLVLCSSHLTSPVDLSPQSVTRIYFSFCGLPWTWRPVRVFLGCSLRGVRGCLLTPAAFFESFVVPCPLHPHFYHTSDGNTAHLLLSFCPFCDRLATASSRHFIHAIHPARSPLWGIR